MFTTEAELKAALISDLGLSGTDWSLQELLQRATLAGFGTKTGLTNYFSSRKSSHVVGFGDSHIEGTTEQGTPSDWRTNQNYPLGSSLYARAVWHSQGKMISVGNYGVGGETSEEVLSRLSEPLSTDASVAIVCVGTNDARQSVSFSTTKTNISSIITGLRAGGIEPVIIELPPLSNPPDTESIQDSQDRINAWLRHYCDKNKVRFVGISQQLIDPSTRNYATGMSSGDGVHISSIGVDLAGKLIAEAISDLFAPVTNWLTISNSDSTNILANALGLIDSTGDGQPDSWSALGTPAGGTATFTLEDISGWPGKAICIEQAANTNTRSLYQAFGLASEKWSVGDLLRVGIRAKCTGSNGFYVQLAFEGSDTGKLFGRLIHVTEETTADQIAIIESSIPVGTTTVYLYLSALPGTGKAYFNAPTMVNLTKQSFLEE